MALYSTNEPGKYRVGPKYQRTLRVEFHPVNSPSGTKLKGIIINDNIANGKVIYSIRDIKERKVYKVPENFVFPDYAYYEEKQLDYGDEDNDSNNLDNDLDYGSEDDE